MFTRLVLIISLVCMSTAAQAADLTCTYPKVQCIKILNAGFSAGAGNSKFNYVYLVCTSLWEGAVVFQDNQVSLAGIIGLNRVLIPPKINFVPGAVEKMSCK